jgi:hypothetical protein
MFKLDDTDRQRVLALSKEERRASQELAGQFMSLKAIERFNRMTRNEEAFFFLPGCVYCGELTGNWCEGAGCGSKGASVAMCNDCEDLKGFCRSCRRHPIAAPYPQEALEILDTTDAEACKACGKYASLRTCSGCKRAKYCSMGCQKTDWKDNHKKECCLSNP